MNQIIRSAQEEINKMERLEKEIDDFLKVAAQKKQSILLSAI
jgi:hypothetical protein